LLVLFIAGALVLLKVEVDNNQSVAR
jgi:hypothetical protein